MWVWLKRRWRPPVSRQLELILDKRLVNARVICAKGTSLVVLVDGHAPRLVSAAHAIDAHQYWCVWQSLSRDDIRFEDGTPFRPVG
jgi:hypothetical protein